ncbi:MAG: response regulator [Candidatus Omnitrophica bacterium]|nr:response regulator [Candidatus Omnitrophota bacterium]
MAKEPNGELRPGDVLTTGQIAQFCNVDPRTVNRWIDQQLLISHALPITGFRRVKVQDFLYFLQKQNMPVPDKLKNVSKHRILIVDDDAAVVNAIKRVLRQLNGKDYEFETAHDGFEAGKAVQKFQPELMILDLKMPRMDGFEVCKQIKSHEDTQSIKILAVSGTVSKEDQNRIMHSGADDFLEKPFTENVLKERVMKMLNQGENHG